MADDFVSCPGGAGVSLYTGKIIELRGIVATPKRRAVVLGTSADGSEVTLPSSGTNVVISGDPRSGKSWMAGLLSEQLVENGYRMCIVDPEGDYVQMGQRPEVLTFGHDLALPSPGAVTRLLSSSSLSTVLTMSSLAPDEQLSYVDQLLAVIQEVRDSTGLPHWLVIDEGPLLLWGR